MSATDGNNGRVVPASSKGKHMTRLKVVAVTIALITSFAVAAEPPSRPIVIQVDGNVVTATGLTPGGACAVVVSWRVRTTIVETWRAGTADGAGSVSAKFPLAAPEGGLIAVIDVESGRLQVSVGDGSFFERVDLPSARLKRNEQRDVDEVTSPQVRAMTVLARAGKGVWVCSAASTAGAAMRTGVSTAGSGPIHPR
jgi:hypothetical protein